MQMCISSLRYIKLKCSENDINKTESTSKLKQIMKLKENQEIYATSLYRTRIKYPCHTVRQPPLLKSWYMVFLAILSTLPFQINRQSVFSSSSMSSLLGLGKLMNRCVILDRRRVLITVTAICPRGVKYE